MKNTLKFFRSIFTKKTKPVVKPKRKYVKKTTTKKKSK